MSRMEIRIDEQVKNDYKKICSDIGTTPSQHIRAFIEMWVRMKKSNKMS